MPELPEVETVRLGLAPAIVGRRIVRVEARRPDLRFPFPPRFERRLTGARVEGIERRGKYLLAPLDTGEELLMHLGMTGRFAIASPRRSGEVQRQPTAPGRHAHVLFAMEGGSEITFIDPRRFGFMDIVKKGERHSHPRLAGLGPDPFDAAFDAPYLASAFARSRQGVKSLLMDQGIVAGLGNIYVCEALHRARIRPTKPARSVSGAAVRRIAPAVLAILADAIAAGGSTIRDYVATDGEPGYFQHRFSVYGRAGEACGQGGCGETIRRTVQSGRATFFCPACQR